MSNSLPKLFPCPFCYVPTPEIKAAADSLIRRIDSDPSLRSIFAEGKMMGVMAVQLPDGKEDFIYAFSGLAGGRSNIDGFVPPIFDCTSVDLDSPSPERSVELQKWLFEQYLVSNALGERKNILEIFASQGLVPPGGTGDCAGPKLLQFAYLNGLKPIAMGEFWYGASPRAEVRRQGCFYPSCIGKCGPLLGFMLRGLDVEPNPLQSDALWEMENPAILHEDESVVVVVKPSGMLAVPGRTAPGETPRMSLEKWLTDYCGTKVFSCHRLDMDTSGIMVFAKNAAAQAAVQRQFENREVNKQYLALLCPPEAGAKRLSVGETGRIELPLTLDYYDRPRQKVDFENGKAAVTGYEVLRINDDGTVEVRFTPFTGRTHQLRVHSAHILGLGRPIAGDRLYGGHIYEKRRRLMLHASYISFRHPVTGARLTFSNRNDM